MQGLSLLAPILLGAFGLALIVALLRILFASLLGDTVGFFERMRLKQKEGLLSRADVYIKSGDYEAAASFLKGAFCLDPLKRDPRAIERLSNHHLALLGRIVGIADRFSLHLDNLAIVEDLLLSRSQLLKTLLDKRVARDLASKKRRGNGPDWAVAEFDSQIKELQDRVSTNRKSLESQISKLFSALVTSRRADEVTYH